MAKHIRAVAPVVPCYFAVYPNAGLPNEFGAYLETPECLACGLGQLAEEGLLNVAGGCCGTYTEHIAQIAAHVGKCAPRALPQALPMAPLRLSGLDALEVPYGKLTCIGERCNVAGSRAFRTFIAEGKYDKAVEIARAQVHAGAQVLDVSMDDALIDGKKALTGFLRACAADPYVSRVPVVVDSSNIAVIEAGLRCVQGKSAVNSISLKEGKETFIRNAKACRKYGAAIVVMAVKQTNKHHKHTPFITKLYL